MIYKIKLTKNLETIVDEDVFHILNKFKWHAKVTKWTNYACRRVSVINGGHLVKMHRVIMRPPVNMDIDHINGDGLDNRRENLRIVSSSQNQQNKSSVIGSTSKFKGVHWHKSAQKWCAQIKVNDKRIYLGVFNDEQDAAKAYDFAAIYHFKEFAKTNFGDII